MNLATPRVLTLVLVVAAGLPAAEACAEWVTTYVDVNADQEPHDGSSWCQAYLGLSEALDAVAGETVIKVADGTYVPDTSGLTEPREATFGLLTNVTIEGGYAGCGAADPDARDIALYETILSGDIGMLGDSSDNAYHVVSAIETDATAVLDGLTITGGFADGPLSHSDGGGVFCEWSDLTLVTCRIVQNSAEYGAGFSCAYPSNPTLVECTIIDNWSVHAGAGVYCSGLADAMLVGCTISGNVAEHSGGGVYCWYSSPTLLHCLITSNTSHFYGGGVCSTSSAWPILVNCAIIENQAQYDGGGMYCSQSSPTMINCTMSRNAAGYCCVDCSVGDPSGGLMTSEAATAADGCRGCGGGLWCDHASPTIANCILWENTPEEIYLVYGVPNVTYCDVEHGWEGEGNIDVDPCFVDVGGDDYRLGSGSPCLDAGDNGAVPKDVLTDLLGNPRFVDDPETTDTGLGTPPIVDMGAYEYQAPACPADVTGDGVVDVLDLIEVLDAWGESGVPADVTGDGVVDVLDLIEVLYGWGACP